VTAVNAGRKPVLAVVGATGAVLGTRPTLRGAAAWLGPEQSGVGEDGREAP